MLKSILSYLTLLFIVFSAGAQDIPVFVSDSLDAYVQRNMDASNIPGLAVLVVKDGGVVVKKGYGVRALGQEEKVDENTLFMIGSNTKAFTATALAMLAEQGKLNMDDRVTDYVPNYTMRDPWVGENAILKDIVSHRMGYRTFQGDFMIFDSDLTFDEIVDKMGKVTPEHPFRTQWGYYNTGFMVAGKVVEKAGGKTWEQFLRDEIFQPLGMSSTVALSSEISGQTNKAAAHSYVNGEMAVIDYGIIDVVGPAGSISSSIEDMHRWVQAQLDNGKWDGEQVIPASAIKTTRTPLSIMGQNSHPFNRSHYQLYGMGWMLQDYEGTGIVSHTGGIHGFVTSVTLVPEHRLGIVVLTNTDANAFYEGLKWEIVDAYLDLPYRNYGGLYSNYTNARRKAQEQQKAVLIDSTALKVKPSTDLRNFEGKYTNPVYGKVTLIREKNSLVMTFEHHPKLKAELKHLSDDRFYCEFNVPLFGYTVFPFDVEGGKPVGFTLDVPDFIEYTDYYFEKD